MRSGKTFEEVEVGETFDGRMTVTESHIVIAAGIFGDFAPLHVDEKFARETRFGTRIAHGTLLTGIMAGVLSSHFHGTAVGYLEQEVRFLAPVLPGDTVTVEWRVTDAVAKEKLGGGIASLAVEIKGEDGTVALEGTAKAIIRGRAAEQGATSCAGSSIGSRSPSCPPSTTAPSTTSTAPPWRRSSPRTASSTSATAAPARAARASKSWSPESPTERST
jgi:acyl dehydratase